MCDPFNETETLLEQILETIRTIKQTEQQFEYQTNSFNHFSDEERRNKLFQIQQNIQMFSDSKTEFNNLLDEVNDTKTAVLNKIKVIQKRMEMKFNEIEKEIPKENEKEKETMKISQKVNKPISHVIYIVDKNRRNTNKIILNVNLNSSIDSIKSKIEEISGIHSSRQKISYRGHYLQDRKTLMECGIDYESTIELEEERVMRHKVVKPIILLYNENESKENEEVEIKLTLNDAMGIGSTYPHPLKEDESDEMKKEYEWKGTYSSNGNKNACQLTMNGKKYDYVFWEGECNDKEQFKGEMIGIETDTFEEEIDELLERLGLNERERNDFIVYWLTKLERNKAYKVTICNEVYDNEIAKLEVLGYSEMIRVMLKFEEIEKEEVSQMKRVGTVERRTRPTGKYVVEWGGILA